MNEFSLQAEDEQPEEGSSARWGMGGHQGVMLNDEWLTPPEILHPLGTFDLDPCAPIERPWGTALQHYTIEDDGLSKEWKGRVWLNPPYGDQTIFWIERLADHGVGTALIFARTDTKVWHPHVFEKATSILFIRGRLHFHYVTGARAKKNSGAPSALIAYGELDASILRHSGIAGKIIEL